MESFFFGMIAVVLIVQLGIVALAMWIGYRLVVSAVRTAILEADVERARRATTAARAV